MYLVIYDALFGLAQGQTKESLCKNRTYYQ